MNKFIFVTNDTVFKIKKIKEYIKENEYKNLVIISNDYSIYKDLNYKKKRIYSDDTLVVIDDPYFNETQFLTKNLLVFISIENIYDVLQIYRYINNKIQENKLPATKNDFSNHYFKNNLGKIITFGYIIPGSVAFIKITSFITFVSIIIETLKTKSSLNKLSSLSFITEPVKYYKTVKNLFAFQLIKKIPFLLEANINDVIIMQFIILSVILFFILSTFIKNKSSFYKRVEVKKLKKDINEYVKVVDKKMRYNLIKHKTYYNSYQITKFIDIAYSQSNIKYDTISSLNPQQFYEVLSSKDFIKECLKLDNKIKNEEFPSKFKMIKETLKEDTVIYSNFPESLKNIKDYLSEQIKTKQYKNILFLDKIPINYYEDIVHLHLIEPFIDSKKKIELIDKFNNNSLTVHQWYCSIDNFSNKIKKTFLSILSKFKNNPLNITDFSSNYEKNITPGEMIIMNEDIIQNLILSKN